jgi:hypothetical protein
MRYSSFARLSRVWNAGWQVRHATLSRQEKAARPKISNRPRRFKPQTEVLDLA